MQLLYRIFCVLREQGMTSNNIKATIFYFACGEEKDYQLKTEKVMSCTSIQNAIYLIEHKSSLI